MNVSDHGDNHQGSAPLEITMRASCRDCGWPDGVIITKGDQDTVRCAQCGRYAGYNAPRTETCCPRQSLRTRPSISVSKRNRILLHDRKTCVICNRRDRPLDVGHIVSLHDGKRLGLSDAELFHDENLAAVCDVCNSGQGSETLPLWLVVAVLRARIARRDGEEAS